MQLSRYKWFIVWIILALFSSSVASAEWLLNGKPVLNSTFAKTDGDFGAKLEFTDKPNELFEAWNKPGLTVKGSFVDEIRRGQSLVALILFSNCAADIHGMANVTVRFKLFDPNGNLRQETGNVEVWINKPAPKYRDLEMSVQFLQLKIGKKDLVGFYSVQAVVVDKNSGKELDLERKFKVR
ncbi:MAG: hypothetical protein HQL26_11150 [Candidatus Omnitrophica bacterium]|nr:hypothetical protein [Candidatus Omnitrophota bacterium]